MTIDMAGIAGDSIVDGPGIRTTYFAQGCPHHCEGCHNPETWDFGAGTPMETEALAAIARANPLCRGVTFSGEIASPSRRPQRGHTSPMTPT